MLKKGRESNADKLSSKDKYAELEYMEKHPVAFVQYAKVRNTWMKKKYYKSFNEISCTSCNEAVDINII